MNNHVREIIAQSFQLPQPLVAGLQLVGDLLALGDVGLQADIIDQRAVLVEDRADGQLVPKRRAVFAVVENDAVEGAALGDRGANLLDRGRSVSGPCRNLQFRPMILRGESRSCRRIPRWRRSSDCPADWDR